MVICRNVGILGSAMDSCTYALTALILGTEMKKNSGRRDFGLSYIGSIAQNGDMKWKVCPTWWSEGDTTLGGGLLASSSFDRRRAEVLKSIRLAWLWSRRLDGLNWAEDCRARMLCVEKQEARAHPGGRIWCNRGSCLIARMSCLDSDVRMKLVDGILP